MRLWPERWRRPRPTSADETDGAAANETPAGGRSWLARWRAWPRPLRWALAAFLAVFLWYGVVGGVRAGIHHDVTLRPTAEQRPAGGSATLGLMAQLIRQQVDERDFTPNDPFFYPTALASRTRAFQSAVIVALHDAVLAMARSDNGEPVMEAADELRVSPAQWWLNGRWPFLGRPAEWHYRRAAADFVRINRELAGSRAGQGSFVASQADRNRILRALTAAFEAEATRGDLLIRDSEAGGVAVQIARTRGTAYVGAILLRGLAEDNASAILGSGRATRWSEALDSLDSVVRIDPWISTRSDLVKAGYSLLMAATAIRSILEE